MITEKEFGNMIRFSKVLATDIDGNTVRVSKESDDEAFVYAKGKKRRGWRYTKDDFCKTYTLVPEKDQNIAWHIRVRRAIKCLESSGLWPELLEEFRNLEKMTWDDKQAISRIYWLYKPAYTSSTTSEEEAKEIARRNEEQIKSLFGAYVDKYPFIFPGNGHVDTSYFWEKSDVKLKRMYFGKYNNKFYLERIENALKNKTRYNSGRVRVNLDHSFEYSPEKNKAWYSEEYRGCGNGHYYLALDSKTALFCEDD